MKALIPILIGLVVVGCGKKKASISVYLVLGGVGLYLFSLLFMGIFSQSIRDFFHTVGRNDTLLIVCLLVVITGTIWGFVDWMRTRTHKRKSQTDPAYANQTEPPPARGIIAFWVGFIFILLCAIAFVIFGLLLLYAMGP
jgi:ABC-type Fe3+ transport system permease subunit